MVPDDTSTLPSVGLDRDPQSTTKTNSSIMNKSDYVHSQDQVKISNELSHTKTALKIFAKSSVGMTPTIKYY